MQNLQLLQITIEDDNGNTLTLRTSNWQVLQQQIASWERKYKGILSIFNGGYQFYIRDWRHCYWDDPTANAIPYETFSIDSTTNGWIIYSVAGSKSVLQLRIQKMAVTALGLM